MPIVNPDSYGAVGDGITNDTAAFNAAKAAIASTGGVFQISDKPYRVNADLTGLNSVKVVGMGGVIGAGNGSRLLPYDHAHAVIDISGSAIELEDFSVVNPDSTAAIVGILNGQINGFPTTVSQAATLQRFRGVSTSGAFSQASFYSIGVGDGDIDGCQFWNSYAGAPGTVVISTYNNLGLSSLYVTLTTATLACPPWIARGKSEFHDYIKGVRPASGCALLLVGIPNFSASEGCSFDSTTASQGAIICLNDNAGTPCGELNLDDFNIYSENAPLAPEYGLYVVPGSTLQKLYVNVKRITTTSAHVSGTIVSQAGVDAPL